MSDIGERRQVVRHRPAMLNREEAADFVGVSTTVFDDEVDAGMWPAPIMRGKKGTKPTWSVAALKARIAELDAQARTTSSQCREKSSFTPQQQAALIRLRAKHG